MRIQVYAALTAVALLTFGPTLTYATCHFRAVVKQVAVVEKVVVNKVFVAEPVYQVYSPLYAAPLYYGAGYDPGVNAGQVKALEQKVDKLTTGFEQLRQSLAAPAPLPPAGPPAGAEAMRAPAKADSFQAIAQRKCASCHDAGVAASKGGKYTLLDGGKLKPLSKEERLTLMQRLKDANHGPQMPLKQAPLTDTEFSVAVTELIEMP